VLVEKPMANVGEADDTRIFPTSPPESYDHTAQPMYSAQVRAFIDGMLEGREPRPNGEDGRVVMRIVEEAYASAGWSG
jgi:predicted dehydrogenase